ncbi:MAG: VWA domain-containing protein, partial [Acidimicrobiales bacterium]
PSPRRLRRQRRSWPLLVPLVPLAAWGMLRLLDDPEPTAASPLPKLVPAVAPSSTLVAFDTPSGERTTAARCWMVVIDESASMATSDQAGTRADAVRATAEFLAAYGLDDDRIGVTWFADTAAAVAPGAATAAAKTPVPPGGLGGGTNIADALMSAIGAMDQGCGSAQRVVVLVSDGQASTQMAFDATAAVIRGAAPDVSVHLIAMNGASAFEDVRAFWEDPALGIASIRTISTFGSDEVAAAVAEILTIETGQQVRPR